MKAALFMAAMIVTAVADDRIHPVCDDTKTPRCWVPHPDQPGRLVPVNKPPVHDTIPPPVREQMVPPMPPPGAGYRSPSPIPPEVRAQMVRRPLIFRFGPLLLFVR
jgi:hypothetical protein